MARTEGVQRAVVACAAEEAGRSAQAVQAVYLQARAGMATSERTRLRRDQRSWGKRRDRECERRYREEVPAQDAPLLFNLCLTELNLARVRDLAGMSGR